MLILIICDHLLVDCVHSLVDCDHHVLWSSYVDCDHQVLIVIIHLLIVIIMCWLWLSPVDCDHSLVDCDFQIWVLTGDKEETAVNISYSAGHFRQGMAELRLTQQRDSVLCAEHICRLMSM